MFKKFVAALLIATPAIASAPPPANTPAAVAPATNTVASANQRRITLGSGGAYQIPKGWFSLSEIGPFLQLEQWDPQRQVWRTHSSNSPNIIPLIYSTGANLRMVNTVDTLVAVENTCAGKSYTSPSMAMNAVIPIKQQGKVRLIVGGAIQVKLHADPAVTSGLMSATNLGYQDLAHNGGTNCPTYGQTTGTGGGCFTKEPTVVFDLGNQTGPFRAPQVQVYITNANTQTSSLNVNDGYSVTSNTVAFGPGQVMKIGYATGNDQGNLQSSGSFSSKYTWTGSGLDASKITAKIVPHPDDAALVGSAIPKLDVIAAPEYDDNATPVILPCNGYSGVTSAEVIDHGGAIGDYDFLEASATVSDSTGSGFGFTLAGNFYLTGVNPGNVRGKSLDTDVSWLGYTVTASSGTGSVATLTYSGVNIFTVGKTIVVAGNGGYNTAGATVTASTSSTNTSTVSYANATTGTVTGGTISSTSNFTTAINGSTVSNGGAYGFTSTTTSDVGTVASSTSKDYVPIFANSGMLDDEISRAKQSIGIGTITNGRISVAKLGASGPGWQYRPYLSFGNRFSVWTSPPIAIPKFGSGVDYFTITKVDGVPTSWNWYAP